MAYKITLYIDGNKKSFERNMPATMLGVVSKAMKVTEHQVKMYENQHPSLEDIDINEELLAEFAVYFWNNQFTEEDVINGADAKATKMIIKGVDDAIGAVDPKKVNEESKK